MPHHLILVKHSQPLIDPGVPARQWQLSQQGQQRCPELALQLRVYLPFELVASDEPKAAQTAERVAQALNLPWKTYPGLHEHERSQGGFSSAEGFQANVQALFEHPAEVVFGSESADQAQQRFSSAIQSMLARQAEAHSLAVVAHGTVISLFVSRCCGMPGFPLWQRLGLPSFIVLTWPEAKIVEVKEKI